MLSHYVFSLCLYGTAAYPRFTKQVKKKIYIYYIFNNLLFQISLFYQLFLNLSTCSTFTSDGSSRFFQNQGTSWCQRLISHLISAVPHFSLNFPVSRGPTGEFILAEFPFMIQQLHVSLYMYSYKLINCCYFFSFICNEL